MVHALEHNSYNIEDNKKNCNKFIYILSFVGFKTAVFTLGAFAAVLTAYIYIVYSLSTPPTILDRI